MRKTLLAFAFLFCAGQASAADPVEGEWLTSGGASKVRIGRCAQAPRQICGVISWLPAGQIKDLDRRNPNPALRARPILGVQTIQNFRQSEAGRWTGGKLYDPGSGKTYNGKISANPNGTLKVEGCVLMVCETQTWTRG